LAEAADEEQPIHPRPDHRDIASRRGSSSHIAAASMPRFLPPHERLDIRGWNKALLLRKNARDFPPPLPDAQAYLPARGTGQAAASFLQFRWISGQGPEPRIFAGRHIWLPDDR
jgi:hypothetical protein